MRSFLVGLALLAGCDQLFGFDKVLTTAPDAAVPDAAPGFVCAGEYVQHCEQAVAIRGKDLDVIDALVTDTDNAASCDQLLMAPNGGMICAKIVDTAEIEGTISVTGSRPLALYAMTSISVTGLIDASKTGGDPSCTGTSGTDQVLANSMNAGGGAGGSFGDRGGDGGAGDDKQAIPAGPKVSGTFVLRRGCDGGAGGKGKSAAATHAAGGKAGGAIYLASAGSIVVSGKVLANGGGGAGGAGDASNAGDFQGGGGGGTGGVILLEGHVTIAGGGIVMAAGGGGGGGSYTTIAGAAGEDPSDPTKIPAGGMAAASSMGTGGAGSIGAPGGAGQFGGAGLGGGAGGGGGGPGIVRLPTSATDNGSVVP